MSASRTIRVAYVLDSCAVGGVETHLLTLLRHLERSRFVPTVILAPRGERHSFGAMVEAACVPVQYHAMPHDKWDLRTLAGLVRLLRRIAPDVVHVHLPFTLDNRYAFVAARVAGCPIVVSSEHLAAQGGVYRRFHARLLKRALVALQDCVIVHSATVGRRLVSHAGVPPRKVLSVNYGVEIPPSPRSTAPVDIRKELGLAEGTPLVGMVARLDPLKRFDDFLAAAREIGGVVPATRFLVVGDGAPAHRAALEALAADLGLGKRVHFTGFRHDASEITAGLDVLVMASDLDGNLPIAALEAMAVGTPVVVTNLEGIAEQLIDGETGYLVPPRSPSAIAERAITLLRDPALADRMTVRARQIVEERFSAARMAEEVQAVYLRLLGRRTRAASASPAVALAGR